MGYLAHIDLTNDEEREQTVKEHCIAAGNYAGKSLEPIGLKCTGYVCGLIHDLGKHNADWNSYLYKSVHNQPAAKENHTFAAVKLLFERYYKHNDNWMHRLAVEILCYAVGGHHGLLDMINDEHCFAIWHRVNIDADSIHYEESVRTFFDDVIAQEEYDELVHKALEEVVSICGRINDFCSSYSDKKARVEQKCFLIGMLARLMLSATVNGDRRDTAEFFRMCILDDDYEDFWNRQLDYFENALSNFNDTSPINVARSKISEQCRDFAYRGQGIFRLSVPTGAGKTLSTLRFSLHHQKAFHKRRIIYVIPLLSVIEQNSKVIRKYIRDNQYITEFHSNVINVADTDTELDRYELLSTTWDSPFIITTLVKFLETLFSGKMDCVQRYQSLADSVILIDEVQSVPRNQIHLFNMAINFLAYQCKATVILCTATQPSFEMVQRPIHFENDADIVRYDPDIWKEFNRTTLINKCDEIMDCQELGSFALDVIEKEGSVLIVTNTKADTAEIYKRLVPYAEANSVKLFHLSKNMCGKHISDTIEEMMELLDKARHDNRPARLICVSSQLIEAGVDISFASVIRVIAGLDNVIQTAGRCNRNSENEFKQPVYVVRLKDENLEKLREIQLSQLSFDGLVCNYESAPEKYDKSMFSWQSIKKYFELLFSQSEIKNVMDMPINNPYGTLMSEYDLLSVNKCFGAGQKFKEDKLILRQAFKYAGREYKVFDDNTIDVIVPYGNEAKSIINELLSVTDFDYEKLDNLTQRAKPYTIQVRRYTLQKLESSSMVISCHDKHYYILNEDCYDLQMGLDVNCDINSYIL